MPAFHFNIVVGTTVLVDDEGTELPNLATAHDEAVKDARSLMSSAILDGLDISGRHINICNEIGETLLVVEFADTIARE